MSNKNTVPDKVEIQKDQSVGAQVASPIAAIASHYDPYPHYIAAAMCAGSAGALYPKNQRFATIAAAFSLAYAIAGRAVTTGSPKAGYDLGSVASLGLTAWTFPMMGAAAPFTVMAVTGGMSSVANLTKSYQLRTGRPHEPIEH